MLRPILLTSLLAFCMASTGRAGLILSFESSISIPAGGTDTIEVYVTPEATGPNVNLLEFGFGLTIDTPYGGSSLLRFVGPRLTYELDSDYVFVGATSVGPSGGTMGPPDTQWIGGDFADVAPLGYVELAAGTTYLLARLALAHSPVSTPVPVPHTFTISVDNGNTFFTDGSGDIDFGSTDGTVTILGGAGVVPEPGSLLILAGLGLCAAPFLRRRRAR